MSGAHPSIPAPHVLVIDDEPHLRTLLDISLRAQGYTTGLAATGQQGLSLMAGRGADLVLLDLGLPDRDGREVLTALRGWSRVPVIVLTVRADEREKVTLLDAGANDYVTKPFGIAELMARVRAALRVRSAPSSSATDRFDDGRLQVDLVQRSVHLQGTAVALTRKEFALLALLLERAGQLVPHAQLLRELWGPTHTEDVHYLRILVGKLRHKLGDEASAPRYILTEPGVGLRFIGQSPA